jgi:hypothetical protein
LRFPSFFVGPYRPLARPRFDVNDDLEKRAAAARMAMGETSLLAKPITRKDQPPVDFERLPV